LPLRSHYVFAAGHYIAPKGLRISA